MFLPKPGKWPSRHLYLKVSGFHARKNPKQQYLKVITRRRSVMLYSAKSALMFTTMQPR